MATKLKVTSCDLLRRVRYPLGAIMMAAGAQCNKPAPRFTNNVEDVPNLTIMSPKLYRALETSNLLPEHIRVGGNA